MMNILRKHKITLLFLLLGGIVGTIFYLKQEAVAIWYVQYEFELDAETQITEIAQGDTLFISEGILVRNFFTSKADTMRASNLLRRELKVYAKENAEREEVTEFARRTLNDPLIRIIDTIFIETQRKKQVILYYLLIGFFAGMIVDFFLGLKKKPSTQDQ